MIYPIKLVTPEEAFGQSLKVGGILKKQEEPIAVPDCPDCPEVPPACEVACRGFDLIVHDTVFGFTASSFYSADHSQLFYSGVAGIYIPQGEWCGHRRRFVFTAGDLGDGYETDTTSNATEGETAFTFTSHASPVSLQSGTLSYQIDLTDAAPGSETWTDLCVVMTIQQGSPA